MQNKTGNFSRRELLVTTAKAGLLAPLAVSMLPGTFAFAQAPATAKKPAAAAPAAAKEAPKANAADLPLVETEGPTADPVAKALKYTHDKSKVAKDLQKEKMGVPFAKQECSTCSLYKKVGEAGGEERGKCTMIAKNHVKAKGWCTSWTKKA